VVGANLAKKSEISACRFLCLESIDILPFYLHVYEDPGEIHHHIKKIHNRKCE
jgi:hypothetical protein